MGMTRAFYLIVNTGFSREELLKRLSGFAAQNMAGLSGKMEEMCRRLGRDDRLMQLFDLAAAMGGSGYAAPVVAYREGTKFFPYFEVDSCEGYTASSRDNDMLARQFSAPVLSFSVVDSDALLASYSDPQRGVQKDCARADSPEVAEELYDTEIYRAEFPDFLLAYCDEADQGKLQDIWESHYVFAEDRMRDIGRLMGVEFLYDEEEMPEGYEALKAIRPGFGEVNGA